MASGTISIPGSKYGHCLSGCHHKDCAESRKMARSICKFCGLEIGYETQFYKDTDPGFNGYIHARCYEKFFNHDNLQAGNLQLKPEDIDYYGMIDNNVYPFEHISPAPMEPIPGITNNMMGTMTGRLHIHANQMPDHKALLEWAGSVVLEGKPDPTPLIIDLSSTEASAALKMLSKPPVYVLRALANMRDANVTNIHLLWKVLDALGESNPEAAQWLQNHRNEYTQVLEALEAKYPAI